MYVATGGSGPTQIVSFTLNFPERTLTAQSRCDLNEAVHMAMHPDGSSIVSVSYRNSTLSVTPVDGTGSVAATPRSTVFVGPNVHEVVFAPSAVPSAPNMFVPTLGDDTVRYGTAAAGGNVELKLDAFFQTGATPQPGEAPDRRTFGRGPRHMVFHPTRPIWAYVLNELNNTVVRVLADPVTGTLRAPVGMSTLQPGYPRGSQMDPNNPRWLAQQASELLMHPNGLYLYVSNRGQNLSWTADGSRGNSDASSDNSIAIFAISQADGTPSDPTWVTADFRLHYPRHMSFSPDYRYLVVGNQRGDSVTTLSVDNNGRTLGHVATSFVGFRSSPAFIAILGDGAPAPPAPNSGANAGAADRPQTPASSAATIAAYCVMGVLALIFGYVAWNHVSTAERRAEEAAAKARKARMVEMVVP
jgi:6-phosphogluconolactonase (cycloisomerase 2 family)